MNDRTTSRRSVLKSGATLASLGLVGGLSGCLGGDSGGDGNDGRIDRVPEGAEFAMQVDVSGILGDEKITERVNGLLEQQGSSGQVPETFDGLLSQIDTEAGFEASALDEILAFGSTTDGTFGAIVWGGWDQETFVSTLREDDFEEQSYSDKTVYVQRSAFGDDTWVGILSDSAYALGTKREVEAIIDTWTGSKDAVDGDVRTAFTAAEGGYIQFGFDIPEESIPDSSSGQFDTTVFRNITYGYGSMSDASDQREIRATLEMESSESAESMKGLITLGLNTAQAELENQSSQSSTAQEEMRRLREALDNVEVSRDGNTVSIRAVDGVDFVIVGLAAVVASFVLGLGEPDETAPNAVFAFDYDVESNELRITHDGGNELDPSSLYIRGQDVQTGRWTALGGSALGGGVAAGDVLTLSNVPPSYEVSVVWQGETMSATLAESEGPDA